MERMKGFLQNTVLVYASNHRGIKTLPTPSLVERLRMKICIVMGDTATSIENMEQCCRGLEKITADYLRKVLEPSTDVSDYHSKHDEIERIPDEGRAIVQDTMKRVKEVHLPVLQVAKQYWKDEDEQALDDACRRLRWKELVV